jgi:flavin-dependent dehydrogenase
MVWAGTSASSPKPNRSGTLLVPRWCSTEGNGSSVSPVAAKRLLLVGDAAGLVSPVTAGGIHTALKHGMAAGHAIADYLNGKSEDPSGWFVRSYPRFKTKRVLRFLFDRFRSDTLFNLLLRTKPMRMAAGIVYFHHKGVFDPSARNV